MEPSKWDPIVDLNDETLNALTPRLGFMGLVALLERLTPDAVPVGHDGPSSSEAIRFRHDPSLTFNARDISKISLLKRAEKAPYEADSSPPLTFQVMTSFLGLTGAVSPMPSYLAEEVAQSDPERSLKREFLDLFHHRLVSLLYRELIRMRLWGEHRVDLRDPWSCRLFAVAGLDTYETPLSTKVPSPRLLRLAPLLAGNVRSARSFKIALEATIADQLPNAEIQLREFVGSWTEVEPESRMYLGRRNSELGLDTILGSRVFDRSNGFEVQIGPVTRAAYERFLPDGDLIGAVNTLAEIFVRDPLEYRVVLELGKDEAPRLQLLSRGKQKLGRNSWLGTRETETFITAYPVQREPSPEPIAAFPGEEYHAPRVRGAPYAG